LAVKSELEIGNSLGVEFKLLRLIIVEVILMSGQLLNVQNVSIRIKNRPILQDINLDVSSGVLVWLEGSNGAGKSTFLRAIAGLLDFQGEIFIEGHRVGSPKSKSYFAYVPDEPALYEDLTLQEHAQYFAMIYEDKSALTRCIDWLERFCLAEQLHEFPNGHSRGMRQKLSLALGLALKTPLLLLDEPFNGLDLNAQNELIKGLCERVLNGGTVMMSAHQLGMLENLRKEEWFHHFLVGDGALTETLKS
jgi:ABC-2 type transport system ATP-binding protein